MGQVRGSDEEAKLQTPKGQLLILLLTQIVIISKNQKLRLWFLQSCIPSCLRHKVKAKKIKATVHRRNSKKNT